MSKTRQQQMDEQMATLIQLMECQQNRQEELAAEQRDQLKTLTGTFEEQQCRLAKQQGEMEERINSLQVDLQTMREVFQQRLGTAENRLGDLQYMQTELQYQQVEKLDNLHTAVLQLSEAPYQEEGISCDKGPQSELPRDTEAPGEGEASMKPLSKEPHVKEEVSVGPHVKEEPAASSGKKVSFPLQPNATAFIPTTACLEESKEDGGNVEDTGDAGGAVQLRTVHRPATFDGRSPWEAYHTQFELLAELNRWKDVEKASYLAVSLRGAALTVLTNLPPRQRRDYGALTLALKNRYGTGHQAELNRAKLRGRIRHREETLPALAEDVERLARLAYPEAANEMIMTLAKDQFLDALQDEDMRLKIRQLRPQSLQQALELALEMESYYLAGKQRNRAVREAHLDDKAEHPVQRVSEGDDVQTSVLKKLQECMESFQKCLEENGNRRREFYKGRAERRARAICWNCKQKGHYRWECSGQPAGPAAQSPASQPMSSGSPGSQKRSGNEQ